MQYISFGGGYGEASTTVNFSLTDTDFWTFKFFGPADTAAGTVMLSGASGVIVSMSSTCVENWHVAHTGFACHAQGATMQLGAGLYTLAFDYELTGSRAGVGGGTAMVDLLTPVPVPAALPLFGAALAGLGMMRRRRSA
jgi:hypothetical protein